MVEAMTDIVVGRTVEDIFSNMHDFLYTLANDGQLRWVGPEKGVQHFAVAALINAIWESCTTTRSPSSIPPPISPASGVAAFSNDADGSSTTGTSKHRVIAS